MNRKPVKFIFLPEKCPTCGSHSIRRVALQYMDFEGVTFEEKKMCGDCNSVFDMSMNLTDVHYNLSPPIA